MSFAAIAGPIAGAIGGGLLGLDQARKEGHDNRAEQREYAQNSIQWKVKDAQAAGIHPLYAMGATGSSFAPVSTGAPEILSNMGQSVGRAFQSVMAKSDREHLAEMNALQRDHLRKQNQLLDAQTTSIMRTSLPPAAPGSDNFIGGQGDSNQPIKVNPSERTSVAAGHESQQKGWVPDLGWARTKTGLTPVPSKDIKERIEDQFIPELSWAVRNQIMPNFGKGDPPPKDMLPKGADKWKWSHHSQEWQPSYWNQENQNKLGRHRYDRYLKDYSFQAK